MTKYTEELKIQVVQNYLDGVGGYHYLVEQYNVDMSMIRRWVDWYNAHGIDGLRKKHTHYSGEFKLFVLTYIWNNLASHNQAAAHFNIRNPGILSQWQRLYRHGGLDALQPRPRGRPVLMPTPITKPISIKEDQPLSQEALLKELNYLRAENAYLKNCKP